MRELNLSFHRRRHPLSRIDSVIVAVLILWTICAVISWTDDFQPLIRLIGKPQDGIDRSLSVRSDSVDGKQREALNRISTNLNTRWTSVFRVIESTADTKDVALIDASTEHAGSVLHLAFVAKDEDNMFQVVHTLQFNPEVRSVELSDHQMETHQAPLGLHFRIDVGLKP